MAKIKPFKALLYNKDKIHDFSKVTCPPYDIISKYAQSIYYANSKYNLIRLILGKTTQRDNAKNNPYTRARNMLDKWVDNKILIKDDEESLYFHKHIFKLDRKRFIRYGIIGLLKLEKSVLGHEKTKTAPKKDRLKLLRKVKANLSPIFVLFPDGQKTIDKIIINYINAHKKPFVRFVDQENNLHLLWKVHNAGIINNIAESMRSKQIFIADGHHRYTVAFRYACEMNNKDRRLNKEQPWDYVMSYFTNMDSDGFVIMPVHRLIKLPNIKFSKDMLDIFEKYFKIEVVRDKHKFLKYFDKKDKHCFGLYFKDAKRFYLLRLKDTNVLKKLFPRHKPAFHNLDIFVLEELIVKKLLHIKDRSLVDYTQDAEKALEIVGAKGADLAFFVSPTRIEEVKEIALIKKYMPVKSTYFYPKVLSGLTMYKFSG